MSHVFTMRAGYLLLLLSLSPCKHPSCSRPGLLKAGDPGLPWLADSWPSTSLPANGGLGSPKGSGNFGRGGKHKQSWEMEIAVLAMPCRTVLTFILC